MTAAVLIVEDDQDIAAIYTELFTAEGYRVLTVFNGGQALSIARTQSIDLMVSDIRMPIMDGIALTTSIRQSRLNFPIILISAIDSREEIVHLANVTFMMKPVNINDLADSAANLINAYRSGSPYDQSAASR